MGPWQLLLPQSPGQEAPHQRQAPRPLGMMSKRAVAGEDGMEAAGRRGMSLLGCASVANVVTRVQIPVAWECIAAAAAAVGTKRKGHQSCVVAAPVAAAAVVAVPWQQHRHPEACLQHQELQAAVAADVVGPFGHCLGDLKGLGVAEAVLGVLLGAVVEELMGYSLGVWEDQGVLAVPKKLLVLQGVQVGLEAFGVRMGV